MVDIKPKVYPCFFCVSLFIVVIGTNLVLFIIGKYGELSWDQVGLIYLIYILPITALLTFISIIIATIITRRSVRELLPKHIKKSLSKQKEMRPSLPEIWYLNEDNKTQRLKEDKLEKERLKKERLEVEKKGMEKRYKRERPIIEKLIQEMKFSDAVLKLKDIKNAAKRYNLSEINSWIIKKLDKLEREKLKFENNDRVKKVVLDLGLKFARLQIAEISEVCGINDVQLIVEIVKDMIAHKEIYAQYFSSTKSVAFDQQANIDEIDNLMSAYKDWEDKKVGKK